MKEIVRILSNIDELETWKNHVKEYSKSDVKRIYETAQPLWLQRMISDGKLFLHPEVIQNLRLQNWLPNELQKKMIWASLIGSDESKNREARMHEIEKSLIRKYGSDWWEDVYSRIEPVYAAKECIKKMYSGSAVSYLVSNTSIGLQAAMEERNRILKRIPKM